jgi:hypothetical protein
MKFPFQFKLLFLIFFPLLVFAQTGLEIEYPSIPGVESPILPTPYEAQHLIRNVRYIFNFAIFSGIIFSLLVLIFAGLRYLYSLDNPQIKADAKNQIFSAFLGLILLVISYNILALLSPDFVVLNPLPLQSRRLFINFLRRIERINLEELVRTLEPTQIPLEVFYPEVQGFRPSIIPFTYALPHYPLNELLAQYINYIYNWATAIGIILALLFLILGGAKYLSARGNVALLAEAKNQIMASLLGLLLILISYGLLRALRPEYTIISPAELPEVEVKIPEGIYFCSERAPMGSQNLDLFQEYILNELYRKYVDPNSRFLFTKRTKAQLTIFVETFCERITTSQNLSLEITGGQIRLTNDEINKLLDVPGLTPEEKQEIIQELSSPLEFTRKPHLYINGPYGIILHEKPDFKGPAHIYLLAEYIGYFPDLVAIQGYTPPLFVYRDISNISPSPSSITVFYDLMYKCWAEGPRDRFNQANVRECLGLPPAPHAVIDEVSFYLFKTRDFGGFEEAQAQSSSVKIDYMFLGGYLQLTNRAGLRTSMGLPILDYILVYKSDTPGQCNPCFSLKFPTEKNWIFVAGKTEIPHFGPIFVTDNSERDLSATYLRSFCKDSQGNEIPCIFYAFAWPAVIIKASQ